MRVIRSREPASLCIKDGDEEEGGEDVNVGCVLSDLIPEDRTYLVTFQHNESGDDPAICWQTCSAIFPNTSLALVSWQVLSIFFKLPLIM